MSTEEKEGVVVPDEDIRLAIEAAGYVGYASASEGSVPATLDWEDAQDILEVVYPIWRQRELALRELVAEQRVGELQRDLLHAGHAEWCSVAGQPSRSCYVCGAERAEKELAEARALLADWDDDLPGRFLRKMKLVLGMDKKEDE